MLARLSSPCTPTTPPPPRYYRHRPRSPSVAPRITFATVHTSPVGSEKCRASLPSSQINFTRTNHPARIFASESGHRTTRKHPATQTEALVGRSLLPSWVNREFAPSSAPPLHVKATSGSAAFVSSNGRAITITPDPNDTLDPTRPEYRTCVIKPTIFEPSPNPSTGNLRNHKPTNAAAQHG